MPFVLVYLHIYTVIAANLRSAVVQELCHLLGVESMLAKVIDADHQNRDMYLPKALFAYRTSLHDVTGFTPFHFTFGRFPQLPIDAMLGCTDKTTVQSYPQFVQ